MDMILQVRRGVCVKRKFLSCAMILVTTASAGPALLAGQSPDEAEIRKVELALQEAWNTTT